MVTRTYHDDDEHFSARRFSNRDHAYTINHERGQALPSPQHAPYARQNMSSHNLNNHRHSPEQDTSSAPRRRIPVACGRCRKRKIRCSGDPGNGQPCDSCKSSGNDTCQFLRVSSTEATLKNDGTDFGYDSATAAAVSRGHCRLGQYGSPTPFTPQATALSDYPYRHSSISSYQPLKYYSVSSYNDFADENVDYTMPATSFPNFGQEPISLQYTAARWSQPQHQKSNSLFVDSDMPYNQLPPYSNTFPYRPSMNAESKTMSLHNMANALSPSVSGTDRLLPAPAPVQYRPSQVAGSYLRSTENPLPASQAPMYNSNNSLMNVHMINAVKALSASSSTESMTSSNYLPLSSSPPDSVPLSHVSYGTNSIISAQHSHENYNTQSHGSPLPLYQNANNSASDIANYGIGHSSNSSSQSRRSVPDLGGSDSQSTANDNGGGSLVNGYEYVPTISDHQTSYPQPPLPLPIRLPEQSSAHPTSRQPISAS